MGKFVRLLIVTSHELRTLISGTSFWNKGYDEISVHKSETVTRFTSHDRLWYCGIDQKISDEFVCVGGPEPSRTPDLVLTVVDDRVPSSY